jgi:hypothetical protein
VAIETFGESFIAAQQNAACEAVKLSRWIRTPGISTTANSFFISAPPVSLGIILTPHINGILAVRMGCAKHPIAFCGDYKQACQNGQAQAAVQSGQAR